MGIAGDEDKAIRDEINEAISDVRAAALPGDVEPDFVKLGYNFRREAMRRERNWLSEKSVTERRVGRVETHPRKRDDGGSRGRREVRR
jgi:hypothetical protein